MLTLAMGSTYTVSDRSRYIRCKPEGRGGKGRLLRGFSIRGKLTCSQTLPPWPAVLLNLRRPLEIAVSMHVRDVAALLYESSLSI
jgi:hypothetical protein